MKRGPKIQKSEALERRGVQPMESQKHRRIADLPVGCPVAPAWLSTEAHFTFTRIAELLSQSRAIAETDRDALALLACYVARIESVLKDPAFDPAEVKDLDRMLRPLLKEFGLTPGSRHVLSKLADPETKTDVLSKYLKIG